MRLNGLTVLQRSDAHARAELRVPADEPFFKGHFPSHPLVPGVVLIEAGVQLAAAWVEQPSRLQHLEEARFYDEVRPNDTVVVTVKRSGTHFFGDIRRGDKLCATMSFTIEAAP